jgi:hypothetical protein
MGEAWKSSNEAMLSTDFNPPPPLGPEIECVCLGGIIFW